MYAVTAQTLVYLALALAAFIVQVWALVQALIAPATAYVAAGKRTKGFWVGVTGAAAAVGFLSFPAGSQMLGFGGILSVAALVAALVFLVDVRPAVKPYSGRRPPQGGNQRGGW